MMSAVIDVSGIDAAEVATFPLAVGLAVANALSQFTANLGIKWPNDVIVAATYTGGWRKLAGILCERHRDIIVAGIGVNVLQNEFPPDLENRATSLRRLGCETSVIDVRDAILDSLSLVIDLWRRDGFASLLTAIERVDVLKGRFVSVMRTDDDANPAGGICGGIASDGSLLVANERIYAGEAHILSVSQL